MNFLTHLCLSYFSATATVMWLVRFRIRFARPLARGWIRFWVGPSSTQIVDTFNSSNIGAVIVLGIGNRRLQYLLDDGSALLAAELQQLQAGSNLHATNLVCNQTRLLGRNPGIS